MKFTRASTFLLAAAYSALAASTAADTYPEYDPIRLSYSVLDGRETSPEEQPLIDALSSEGLVSITDIPSFAPIKKSLMKWLHACIMDQGPNAEHVLETIQKDGTIRRTIASVTVPGPGGDQDFKLKGGEGDELSPSCREFSNSLGDFRAKVAEATSAFSHRLTEEMGSMHHAPLLTTEDGAYSFNTIDDIVSSGQHLEHFHSYQKLEEDSSSSPSSSLRSGSKSETIELHTDQGFFIAFVPGLMVTHHTENDNDNEPDLSADLRETEGFYIQKSDGTKAHVHFDSRDDLIFMMGDGVNQYINPKMKKDGDGVSNSKLLRATPHSVTLPAHERHLSRVWYGRMILPPAVAQSNFDGKSYGEVRALTTHSEVQEGGIGCSTYDHGRALSPSHGGGDDTSCAHGYHWCWARCMSLAEHDVSHEICEGQQLRLQCINPRDQFSTGDNHGDYYPGCSNTTEEQTPYPNLDNFPQNETICTTEKWEAFAAGSGYDFSHDFGKAKLLWSVVDGKVHGRIAFNGLFGYLALGFANLTEGAGHNGMNGASILMAKPSDTYSAVDGWDFSQNSTIEEHVIHHSISAFRVWQDPITVSTSSITSELAIDDDECFTSFSFQADGINSQAFNLSGSDVMMWAGNGMDKYAGYHLPFNRAKFNIEWSTGVASVIVHEHEEEEEEDDDNAAANLFPSAMALLVSAAAAAFM